MSTFDELTDGTLLHLSGFTTLQEMATWCTGVVGLGDTLINVADVSAISRGVIEIGDELIWVDTVDTTSNAVTVPPYGRGYRSSVAAVHALGSRVGVPVYPRYLVKRAINETIQSLYPDLFGVGTTTFTYVVGTYSYSLPFDAETVLAVQWQDLNTPNEWNNVRRYDVNGHSDTTSFATGNSITLWDNIVPGRTVRVVYAKQPSVLVNPTDDFATVTGLPASCEDLVRLGAAVKIIPFLEVPHITGQSAEADFNSANRQIGSAAQTSKWLLQNYQLRLQQESIRLNSLFPVRVRYTN